MKLYEVTIQPEPGKDKDWIYQRFLCASYHYAILRALEYALKYRAEIIRIELLDVPVPKEKK